jgi:hypothetical protein
MNVAAMDTRSIVVQQEECGTFRVAPASGDSPGGGLTGDQIFTRVALVVALVGALAYS